MKAQSVKEGMNPLEIRANGIMIVLSEAKSIERFFLKMYTNPLFNLSGTSSETNDISRDMPLS